MARASCSLAAAVRHRDGVCQGGFQGAARCGRDVCFSCPRWGAVPSHRDSLSSWPWPRGFHSWPPSSAGLPTGAFCLEKRRPD